MAAFLAVHPSVNAGIKDAVQSGVSRRLMVDIKACAA